MKQAIAILNFKDERRGIFYFYTKYSKVNLFILLKHIDIEYGLLKGLHIHQCGDLTDGCASACAHYNPTGKSHGDLSSRERHYGDLGNIQIDQNGNAQINMYNLPLTIEEIVGRSVVLHEAEDDLGKGRKRYTKNKEEIASIILKYLEYSNREICYQIMGEHELLAKLLEDKIGHKLNLLRKWNDSDEKLYKLVQKIIDFVENKIMESSQTGNSGSRLGCGIIGFCQEKNIEDLIVHY